MKNKLFISITLFFLVLHSIAHAQDFVTRWNLSNTGAGTTFINFMAITTGPVSYTWETVPSGSVGAGTFLGGSVNITGLPAGSIIRLSIDTTNFRQFKSTISTFNTLVDIEQWGGVHWSSFEWSFSGCQNLTCTAIDYPDLTQVTNLGFMFQNCTILNGPSNIQNWDISGISNLSSMFEFASAFNQPLDSWNTQNVTNMSKVFRGCFSFNQPLDSWNTQNVTNMSGMFDNALAFNQPIGNWNTQNVFDMSGMFNHAHSFNQPIGNWNTQNVFDMSGMFSWAMVFNQPIGNWNTQNVTSTGQMFLHASAFNQPIGNWNTQNVTDFGHMFNDAISFNQPIGNWNTQNVTSCFYMFTSAISFNQPIGNWNTQNVTSMSHMFANTINFNQPIDNWNTQNVTDMSYMFSYAINFNQPINNWNTQNVTNMSHMFNQSFAFNQPINNWNTQNVTNMSFMFSVDTNFNQPLDNWNTQNVTDMSFMFYGAKVFNHPIGNWNTQNVTDMSYMYFYAIAFDQPLDNWNTQNVTNMSSMFHTAVLFNQSINNWNTQNVTNMSSMFHTAVLFNQSINNWNTSLVDNMTKMFYKAYSFNHSIGNWQLGSNVNMDQMLDSCGMNCINYSATLNGWNSNPQTPNGRILGAIGMNYLPIAFTSRNNLDINKSWTFNGDIANSGNCCIQTFQTITDSNCSSYFFNNQTLFTSGTYYDTLINSTGCDSLITLNLTINQVDTAVTQSGANLVANALGAVYQWLSCPGFTPIAGQTNQSYTATSNGDYAVEITLNGCKDTSACYNLTGIGISESNSESSFSVYPNPVSGFLFIQSAIPTPAIKEMYNSFGQLLIRTTQNVLDLSSFSRGVYYLKCESHIEKIVVQ